MVSDIVVTLSVMFSLITGTAAALLSLLTFEILRRSPFGRAVLVLSLVMWLFVVYHVAVLFSTGNSLPTELVKSAVFTGVAASVWIIIWNQRRVRRSEPREVNPQ